MLGKKKKDSFSSIHFEFVLVIIFLLIFNGIVFYLSATQTEVDQFTPSLRSWLPLGRDLLA